MIKKLINAGIVLLVGTTLLPAFAEGNRLIGWTCDEENITHTSHKQTYKEYVEERLEVERLLR